METGESSFGLGEESERLPVDEEAAGVFQVCLAIESFRARAWSRRWNGGVVVPALQVEKCTDAGVRAESQPTADSILIGASFFNEEPPAPKVRHAQPGRSRQIVKVAGRAAVDGQGHAAVPGSSAVVKRALRAVAILALIVHMQAHAEVGGRAVAVAGRLVLVVTVEIQLRAEAEIVPVPLGEIRAAITVVAVQVDEQPPAASQTLGAVRRIFAEEAESRPGPQSETVVLKGGVLRLSIRRIGSIVGTGITSAAFV